MALSVGVIPWLASSIGLYAWTFVLAFSNSVFAPAATGLVSVYADPREQGTILGAAQAIGALGRMAGPPAVGTVYDAVSSTAAFLVAGGVMVVAGLASLRLERVSHAPPTPPEPG
jgi:MFS family permease